MGKDSRIEWTDATFNPWRGCSKVSPGCLHCYAQRDSTRWGLDLWGPEKDRKVAAESSWRKPLKWDLQAHQEGKRMRVFCASYADVFEDRPELVEPRLKLWLTILATANLDWLLLTKRPENINALAHPRWRKDGWPDNVWLGTSVEDQEAADARVPQLLKVKAKVRFLSCEPLLGPVNFRWAKWSEPPPRPSVWDHLDGVKGIHWVIVGGESGPKARPMQADWARAIRDQCNAARVPLFVKQLGGWPDKRGSLLDLPEDLRIRRFPGAA